MATIDLKNVAKFYKALPHQDAALNYLQSQISSDEVIAKFLTLWRSAPPSTSVITPEQATHIFGRTPTRDQMTDLNACLLRYKINTPNRQRHFLAQIAHESGGLKWLQELDDGSYLEGRDELGNTEPGDGPRFKGAGAIQLTGRSNYEAFAKEVDDPRVMEGCAYVASTYPFTSAGAWWEKNDMNSLCDRGAKVEDVTRRVNGGVNGLADRLYYYNRARQVI